MENLLCLWNVLSMKCPIYEMSFFEIFYLWNVLSMIFPNYEMSYLCLSIKCHNTLSIKMSLQSTPNFVEVLWVSNANFRSSWEKNWGFLMKKQLWSYINGGSDNEFTEQTFVRQNQILLFLKKISYYFFLYGVHINLFSTINLKIYMYWVHLDLFQPSI